MNRIRGLAEPFWRLYAIVGTPGAVMGFFSLVAFAFGLVVLAREYDRLRQTGREALRPIVAGWVRTAPVHYVGWTLTDYADRWRKAPATDRPARLADLRAALNSLGNELDRPSRRSPLIEIVGMTLISRDGTAVGTWHPPEGRAAIVTDLADRIPLLPAQGDLPPVDLAVHYHVAPEIERAFAGLEAPYHRLLLALLGLSIYPLLCLVYMGVQARALRDRAAHESAQAATLDLADRTCHELGNVAFVLSNERRNLADHLDLVDRFVSEESEALSAAGQRSGLTPAQSERFQSALRREYADRGIDPVVELRTGASIARIVCRQIAVCSDYMSLTVQELDGYLKQSSIPVRMEPIAIEDCLNDALALLGPRLEASDVQVDRSVEQADGVCALGDRRLLVHALVNLLKNAAEATGNAVSDPRITLSAYVDGDTVWIDVADNGPGIPPAELPQIFEFGFSTKGAGRGRGLAIVHESIVAQHGRIEVESTPDVGTRFRIGLPVARDGDVAEG
jgi:signal transduction histidine kinase